MRKFNGKTFKKILCFSLSVAMTLCCFSACTNDNAPVNPGSNVQGPDNEGDYDNINDGGDTDSPNGGLA